MAGSVCQEQGFGWALAGASKKFFALSCLLRYKQEMMKTISAKNLIPSDSIPEGPVISFQHLSFCFFSEDTLNEDAGISYGFPDSQEENLYKTGFLMKEFLKC